MAVGRQAFEKADARFGIGQALCQPELHTAGPDHAVGKAPAFIAVMIAHVRDCGPGFGVPI